MRTRRAKSLLRGALALAALVWCAPAALASPYTVETQVRTDLEAALTRLMPPRRFLVQVSADVDIQKERRIIEGEEIVEGPETRAVEPPEPMPGFQPDSTDPVSPPRRLRQLFRTVESPRLSTVRVVVAFDRELDPDVIAQAKQLVKDYVLGKYPERGRLNFMEIRMRAEETPDSLLSPAHPLWKSLPWALAGLLLLWVLFGPSRKTEVRVEPRVDGGGAPQPAAVAIPFPGFGSPPAESPGSGRGKTEQTLSPELRSRLLGLVINNADAFRLYYDRLPKEEKQKLEAALAGPAFESLMENIKVTRSKPDVPPADLEEATGHHGRQFTEFVQAQKWQENRFFGFVQQLSREQLLTLVNFESDKTVCLMLRFLKPEHCAFILDNVSADRRQRILAEFRHARHVTLTEIAATERELREAIERLPSHILTPGKGEVDFWGTVVQESEFQADLLRDIERSDPEVFENVKRFKFTLEDAASLPDGILGKVLSEVDNEEFGLALATCAPEIRDVLLDSISPRRREVIEAQLPSYRSSPKDVTRRARKALTRKIQEAMHS